MRKKKTVRTKEELLEEYHKLKKEKNGWWNILASEGNSIKTIVGGFILYIGYLIVASLGMDALLLIYTIIVVGVIWYWVDMLRTQYERNQKAYKKQMRILNNEIRRWSKKKIVVNHPNLKEQETRQYRIAQTYVPYIWGYSPETIKQYDYYQYKNVDIATVQINQEQLTAEYWFISWIQPQHFETGTTMLLPKPYQHDKWSQIHFNQAIELPKFRENYSIFSSEFMHSYYSINRTCIQEFLDINTTEKYLVFRENKGFLLMPKDRVDWDITNLEATHAQVEKMTKEILLVVDQLTFFSK